MDTRILVLDNDQSTRHLMTATLQHDNNQVIAVEYFEMDLVVLDTLEPDLIILNFKIRDGGEGREFLQLDNIRN